MRRFRDAIHYYREAARLDAAYLGRSYYWREIAGVLFLSRRYALAAKLYRRSLDIQGNRRTRALLADALMFSGQYRVAEELFAEVLEATVAPDDAEWALKCVALSSLRELTGFDKQRRTVPTFPDSFNPKESEEGEIERVCMEALGMDALSPLAWFNLGGVRHRAGDYEPAARYFLLAALVVPWDLDAWGNVIGLAVQTGNHNLLGHALCVAYRVNGEEFLRHMADLWPDNRDALLAMFAEVVDALPSQAEGTLLRGLSLPKTSSSLADLRLPSVPR
jgi:tetratricopeptide (TPR) repeat protein